MTGRAASVESVTVTGTWLDLDGNPCTGVVQFEPGPCTITVAPDNAFMQGVITAQLDGNGSISVDLPCTDQAAVNPKGWTYKVTVRVSCQACPTAYYINLPCGTSPLDLADLAPVDSDTGQAVVVGPQGPKGDTGATGATGPQGPAGLGSVVADDDTVTVDDRTPEFGVSVNVAALLEQVALDGLPPIVITGAGTVADPWQVELEYSGDPGNRARNGSDGGLLVPPAVVDATAPIVASGTGTDTDPYEVSLRLSADSHNTLVLGSDGGLYQGPAPFWSGGNAAATPISTSTTAFTQIPAAERSSSGPADFTVNADGSVTVLKAGTYAVDMLLRHTVVVSAATASVVSNLLGAPSSFGNTATPASATYLSTVHFSGEVAAGTQFAMQARFGTAAVTSDSIGFATLTIHRLGD